MLQKDADSPACKANNCWLFLEEVSNFNRLANYISFQMQQLSLKSDNGKAIKAVFNSVSGTNMHSVTNHFFTGDYIILINFN